MNFSLILNFRASAARRRIMARTTGNFGEKTPTKYSSYDRNHPRRMDLGHCRLSCSIYHRKWAPDAK